MRQHSPFDQLIAALDNGLKTLSPGAYQAARQIDVKASEISDEQQEKHTAALMRINHTGEVCAQALYQGQALTAKNKETRAAMQLAADEEIDHLVWCEQRIKELGGHTSYLNPLFYGMSFIIGAATGAISDKVSLGFVEATEDQVCKHLEDHLGQVPESDERTRAILEQMLEDEAKHGHMALENGGVEFPQSVKAAMSLLSKVMTASTYRI